MATKASSYAPDSPDFVPIVDQTLHGGPGDRYLSAMPIGVVTAVIVVASIGFAVYMIRKSGALGPSKAKRELAAQLVQTGSKARAMILAIQPTGTVVNNINIQCHVRFRLDPLHGGMPFEGDKTMLIAQTSMPRIGDIWPSWYNPADVTQFAVGQPESINAEQIATFREFGIPHPLDREWRQS